MSALDTFVSALDARGLKPRRASGGQWSSRCPAHDDRTPSLSFAHDDGQVLLHCHTGCNTEHVLAELDLDWTDLYDTWDGLPLQHPVPEVLRPKRRESALVTSLLVEAMEEEPEEPDWLWHGYLASGWLTLLAGLPKTGKTTLLCGLLDAMSRGVPFLDQAVRPTGALILTEQAPSVYKATLENFRLGYERERVHVAFYRRQKAHTWPELIGGAIDVCRRESLGLLVIDTWARWASMQADHDAPEILRTLAPLGQAAESGLAVLIVHHSRKEGGSHGTEVSGRVEIVAAVDVVLSLARQGDARRLTADGRSTKTRESVSFTLDVEGGFQIVDAGHVNATTILDALRATGEAMAYEEIATATGLSRANVVRTMGALLDDRTIEDAGKRGRARIFRAL